MIQHLADILHAAGVPLLPISTTQGTSPSTTTMTTTFHHTNDSNDDDEKEDDDARFDAARILTTMEVWIGLQQIELEEEVGEDGVTVLTVEDCLPLSDDVMNATIRWLIAAWNDTDSSTGTTTTTKTLNIHSNFHSLHHSNKIHSNLLQIIAALPPPKTTSTMAVHIQNHNDSYHPTYPSILTSAVNSIRATKYLRTWMVEFNIDTTTTNENTDDDDNDTTTNGTPWKDSDSSSLSRRLLSTIVTFNDDTTTTIPATTPSFRLIQALFHHFQNLPLIQQQIVSLTQHLQQSPQSSRNGGIGSHQTSSSSDDPHATMTASSSLLSSTQVTKRLQQYEHTQSIVQQVLNEFQQHLDDLEYILGDLYAAAATFPAVRCYIRQQLGQVWTNFIRNESIVSGSSGSYANTSMKHENTKAVAMRLTLNVLRRILLGMSTSTATAIATMDASLQNDTSSIRADVRDHLLFHQLIPLHEVNGVVLWRDQVSILELYHEPLCQCIAILIQQDLLRTCNRSTIIFKVIQQLLQRPNIFPTVGSTSKQVLLLHEIDTYLRLIPSSTNEANNVPHNETYSGEESVMLQILCKILARCMSSEHSRVAERALQLFQSSLMDVFFMNPLSNDHNIQEQRRNYNLRVCLRTLLPALIRREPSWNPTVRKMTFHVVKKLQVYNDEIFVAICNELFSHHQEIVKEAPTDKRPTSKLFTETNDEHSMNQTSLPDLSLKAGMGNWRPPINTPNIPGRGVAPWSTMNNSQQPSFIKQPRLPSGNKSSAAPPLTITGVAPWAMQQTKQATPMQIRNTSVIPTNQSLASNDISKTEMAASTSPKSGYDYVVACMEKIKPPLEEEGISSWSQNQMAETPTLLPNLKFHDLVFGHELGTGAFGSVKYARLIEKTKSRSYWPEYAVKVVSTNKIYEMGYEVSIQREIAVLYLLSHPGIARLVSSFRFKDGAYLVLEYASRGDLHSLLQKHGSLDVESTRFVIGEIVAALASIHDLGFVYGDLKPENIVITEPGHIKLTDFGGCRPITKEAKQRLSTISKDILKNLRNGDWKDTTEAKIDDLDEADEETQPDNKNIDNGVDEWMDDLRVEGTTAYLPPEVVMGSYPSFAADTWALGCVTYQCLTGRPPLLEADDRATRNRIVSFDVGNDELQNDVDQLFIDKHAAGVSFESREFIKHALDRDPLKRPSMNQMAEHEFFTTNVFALHSQPAYPLDVGSVGPTPNAQWARRQFSSIWAPQPEAYNISISTNSTTNNTRTKLLSERPIVERDEASGFFSITGKLSQCNNSSTTGKRDRKIMLPPSYE